MREPVRAPPPPPGYASPSTLSKAHGTRDTKGWEPHRKKIIMKYRPLHAHRRPPRDGRVAAHALKYKTPLGLRPGDPALLPPKAPTLSSRTSDFFSLPSSSTLNRAKPAGDSNRSSMPVERVVLVPLTGTARETPRRMDEKPGVNESLWSRSITDGLPCARAEDPG